MNKLWRWFAAISFFLALLLSASSVRAANQVTLHFFYGDTCPHCAKAKPFLTQLEQQHDWLTIKSYEIYNSDQHRQLMRDLATYLGADQPGVPFFVLGSQYLVGYLDDQTTGQTLLQALTSARDDPEYQDLAGLFIEQHSTNFESVTPFESTPSSQPNLISDPPTHLNLPFLGQLNLSLLSLPALTFIIALVDGFNPCAMWVLVFLISMLLGLKRRRRMWLLGGSFILASGMVYFLFLTAWLNLFLFIGFLPLIRLSIGLLAMSIGTYYLYDFFTNPAAACKVSTNTQKQRIFSRIKSIVHTRSLIAAVIGIVILAFAVNLLELACSAGLPAVYTQILAQANLSWWQHYFFLVLYILIFMADDMFVFILAMSTLQLTGLNAKFTRASHLIGALVMLFVGLSMIFKPEFLSFGHS